MFCGFSYAQTERCFFQVGPFFLHSWASSLLANLLIPAIQSPSQCTPFLLTLRLDHKLNQTRPRLYFGQKATMGVSSTHRGHFSVRSLNLFPLSEAATARNSHLPWCVQTRYLWFTRCFSQNNDSLRFNCSLPIDRSHKPSTQFERHNLETNTRSVTQVPHICVSRRPCFWGGCAPFPAQAVVDAEPLEFVWDRAGCGDGDVAGLKWRHWGQRWLILWVPPQGIHPVW